MSSRGIEIYKLHDKMRVISQTLFELQRLRNPTAKAFSENANINYNTLKAAWQSGRISEEIQDQISSFVGFDLAHHTWVDHDIEPIERAKSEKYGYPGRDTPENFRFALRSHFNLPSAMFLRVDDNRPALADPNMLTFGIDDNRQSTPLDSNIQLFLTLVVEPGYIDETLSFGFSRLKILLHFESGSEVKTLRSTQVHELSGATLVSRGTDHHSEWLLQTPKGILEGEYATKERELCELINANIGDKIRCEVLVRPIDGSLRSQSGAKLPKKNKQRVIEALYKSKLPSPSDTLGWISLGMQNLEIVKGDSN